MGNSFEEKKKQIEKQRRKKRNRGILRFLLVAAILVALCFFLKIPTLIKEKLTKKTNNTVINTGEDSIILYPTGEENIVEDEETGQKYVNNELVINAKSGVSDDIIAQIVKDYGGSIVGQIKELNQYQIQLDSNYTYDQLFDIADEIALNSDIRSAIPNYFISIESNYYPSDDIWKNEWSDKPGGKNWGVEAIGAPQMWDIANQQGSSTIRVGVLDNQFYTDHEDLNYAEVFLNDFSMDLKRPNHGTHVSGTIAAVQNDIGISGIVRNYNLYGASYKGLSNRPMKENADGVTVSEYEAGLTYLIVLRECKVINLSYGGGAYDYRCASQLEKCLRQYIDEGYDYLICKAAGNDRINYRDYDTFALINDPVVLNHIITVGSAKLVNDNIYISEFSNYGDMVDIIAPGSNIYSTICDDYSPFAIFSWSWGWYKSTYGPMDGTSMAAPHVTGTAAEIWSVNPSLHGDEIKRILCSTATGNYTYEPYENQKTVSVTENDETIEYDINSKEEFKTAYSYSYPMLNASKAMEEAVGRSAQKKDNKKTKDEEEPVGAIAGYVYDADYYSDIPNAIIDVYVGEEYIGSDYADESGEFEIVTDPGYYNIVVGADGYQSVLIEDILIEEDQITDLEGIPLEWDEQALSEDEGDTGYYSGDTVPPGVYVYYSFGFIRNEFTFYGDHQIDLNALGVNGNGTYEIKGDYIIIRYRTSIDDYSELYEWKIKFRFGDNGNIFIGDDEFIKES